ncbi:MAG TPA: serine protease [Acetobacteraceae bacterium]
MMRFGVRARLWAMQRLRNRFHAMTLGGTVMRTLIAELSGLALGFAVGGAALMHFLPQIERWRQPEPVVSEAPLPSIATPAPIPVVPARPTEATPSVAIVLTPDPEPLPNVVSPDQPQPEETAPQVGTGDGGTGFFVADRLVMTAAHVVNACRTTQVVSQYVDLTAAELVARDAKHDIALLRVPQAAAPAVLGIGKPAAGDDRVFVLGYPSSAGRTVPEETWGRLENARMPREPASLTDPREMLWMQALDVRHGYSGGPIFDPRTGLVAGIVRATVDGSRLSAIAGMPRDGIDIGPGSARLAKFLEDEEPGLDAFPASQWGDDPLSVVRHATVHVFCWH